MKNFKSSLFITFFCLSLLSNLLFSISIAEETKEQINLKNKFTSYFSHAIKHGVNPYAKKGLDIWLYESYSKEQRIELLKVVLKAINNHSYESWYDIKNTAYADITPHTYIKNCVFISLQFLNVKDIAYCTNYKTCKNQKGKWDIEDSM
ncbi:MAG: hypothetical protein J0H68_05120 [Sphingobacteriia bacterium]|nr:hypothetical protein [Sphingobacteriia bacterium]